MSSTEPEERARIIERRHAALKRAMLKRGLRNTRQREAVTEIFFASDHHFNLEELLALARERDEGIGYATVYRTVRMLTELGLATERRFSDGQTRYEAADGVHHDHLICTECSEIVEFENDEIEVLQERVASLHGYRLLSHRMELYGLCASCQKREVEPNEHPLSTSQKAK